MKDRYLFRIVTSILCGILLASAASAEPPEKKPAASASKDVTAAQVNGTWEYRRNTFKIWALGGGKLQLSFDGLYAYKSAAGPMANIGEAAGIATIEGDTAVFHPEGADPTDKITLQFAGGKLRVKQEGNCGFGHSVYADGTYRKVSGKKPKFDE